MAVSLAGYASAQEPTQYEWQSNPILRDVWTADPAPLVVGDTLYVYVGHDEAKEGEMFNITEWLCYSTKDMKTWTAHGSIMKPTDFEWAIRDAWAAQVVERDGKFYFYTTVQHDDTHAGKAIGVAVSDSPTGPFVDARGSALVTEQDTPSPYGWDDIDPTVLIDDDGTAWMAWGNPNCYLVKLKPNMIELDGPIQKLHVPNYTEGPWFHKRDGLYYLFYPAFAHQGMWEKICYATAENITGPWTYQGILTDQAENSYTIHPGVVEFQGQTYLFYHNATLSLNGLEGTLGRRSVCVEYLYFNPDGTIQPIEHTKEGISVPPSPASGSVAEEPSFQKSSPGVKVMQSIEPDPKSWPGAPRLASVANPYWNAPRVLGFNMDGGSSRMGQTFVVDQDFRLTRVLLYAGDGMGATKEEPVRLALYDLGPGDSTPEAYEPGENLLGESGVEIAYTPQARGLLRIDFNGKKRVHLKKGLVYAFELQGEPGTAPLFWRRSDEDVYSAGAAYRDGKPITVRENQCDFAIALY
ncbi:glycoside hydrolase family 43 protein [Pelagicoccus sp. SDUM812003]|nr:glycoside hydrolase family 43 protein [Pelagicoccus sp. SDUM812003]MDQ8203498.1 glycoside hydrolase family 43 protein [Pelagicoccus sp. SDUM812003]